MKKIFFTAIFVCWSMVLVQSSFSLDDYIFPEDESTFVWGDMKTPEGIRFTLPAVQVREWTRTAQSGPVKMMAITYGVSNETKNKKIDLNQELVFRLTDEFGNTYQSLDKPLDFDGLTVVHNKNFPSLYPGEQFSASIFFEAPVETSQVLDLTIDAKNFGVADSVRFRLPVDRALPEPVKERIVLTDEDMQLDLPKRLNLVAPGDRIPIKVGVSDKLGDPDSVYIITPGHVYEDSEALGRYAIRIPKDQGEGPFLVVVMTRWREDGQEQTLSKSFTVMVKHPRKACAADELQSCAGRTGLVQVSPAKDL